LLAQSQNSAMLARAWRKSGSCGSG
jgi:hypothetical protein